jgi:peptidoglycan/xylan/chitin deacetylase (PgdA/CDA1 family)
MNPVVHRIPILNYHKIDQRFEWGLNTVKPVRFRQQMQLLKDGGFTPVNFHRVESGALPEKPIIITFDDGYESVYDSALPVLQELDFTAVVFIITDYMGEENTWDANIGGIRFQHLNAGQIREKHTGH